MAISTNPQNMPRNKFKNIIVCMFGAHDYLLMLMNTYILSHSYIDDDSRVILRPLPGRDDCQHDYINASYVDVSISG